MSGAFSDSSFSIYNAVDNTKELFVDNSGATTGTSTTLQTTQTANAVIAFPSESDTLVGLAAPGILTNKTIADSSNNVVATGLWNSSGSSSVSMYTSSAPTVGQTPLATSSSTATWQSIPTSISGTANEIVASNSTGAVTLSIPPNFVAPGTIQDTDGLYYSTATVSASGNTQTSGTVLSTSYCIVNANLFNHAVVLPTVTSPGMIINILAKGNSVYVYPASGAQIDNAGINASVAITLGGYLTLQAASTTQWYSVNPCVVSNSNGLGVTYSNGTTEVSNTGVTYFNPSNTGLTVTSNTGDVVLGGELSSANGGLGTNIQPSDGQIPVGYGNTLQYVPSTLGSGPGISTTIATGTIQINNTGATSVSGTTNQITSSSTTGAITLFIPNTFVAPGTVQDSTGMMYSTSASVTASGTNQSGATPLTRSYSVVRTCVLNSNGVILPTPSPGLIMVVANKGSFPLAVFPASGGSIDSNATNAYTTVIIGGVSTFQAASSTQWFTINSSSILYTTNQSVTATTGGQAGAALISSIFNIVTTVPSGGGVQLPYTSIGQQVILVNAGSNQLSVYPPGGGQIDNAGVNTSVPLPVGATATYQQSYVSNISSSEWYTVNPNIIAGVGTTVTYGNGNTTVANNGVTSIAGTPNQINASASTGAVTLSFVEPQSSITSVTSAISTAETYVSKSFPIGASTINAGDSFHICAYGTCSSTSSSGAPTFNVRFGISGTTSDTNLLSSAYTSANTGSSIPFKWSVHITFQSATSAIVSSNLQNKGTTGISTTTPVPHVGTVVTGLTTSASYLGLSFVTSSSSTSVTFSQVIVTRVR